ncbi:hypothetical protein llap_17253 [Limosa lapponica baueri]|uniref:Uncharacterized protein n=1 Tax=Limosa lapponica baueri TaxID=1758121 RepID=A0A2I0TF51_LIMLA|nr:hypothetical protein llap_17253 [Limosa lapponica baueri]
MDDPARDTHDTSPWGNQTICGEDGEVEKRFCQAHRDDATADPSLRIVRREQAEASLACAVSHGGPPRRSSLLSDVTLPPEVAPSPEGTLLEKVSMKAITGRDECYLLGKHRFRNAGGAKEK